VSGDSGGRGGSNTHGRRAGRWLGATLVSVVIAGVTAFAVGVGSKEADKVESGRTLSYSVTRFGAECGFGTYLPESVAQRVLQKPRPANWGVIEEEPGAAAFSESVAQVSIQGESERTVVLTGVRFKVRRQPRPQGAVFEEPCGGPLAGRALVADLDVSPPRIVASSSDPNGIPGSEENGAPSHAPIRFPWTVSVTDPLLLYVIAKTDSCYCKWTAELPWVSGGRHGSVIVDNGGKEFAVVGGANLTEHLFLNGHWEVGKLTSPSSAAR